MQTWRKVQNSKGAIKSSEITNKEAKESILANVLACLQTDITEAEILKQIERTFADSVRRTSGLVLLDKVISMELPFECKRDSIEWFCSALRANTNKYTHYMDGINGCGAHQWK